MRMFLIPDEVKLADKEPLIMDGQEVIYTADVEKCGGCNWEVENIYRMADTQEQANAEFKEEQRGLCGDCMCELLVDGEYIIQAKENGGADGTRD